MCVGVCFIAVIIHLYALYSCGEWNTLSLTNYNFQYFFSHKTLLQYKIISNNIIPV